MTRRPSIFRDSRGTSFVELGFILPIFATMLLGVVDISRAYSQRLQMQQAVQRAVERVQRNGYRQVDDTTIISEAADGAGVTASAVTLDAWLECNGTKMAYTDSCSDGQTMARYVTLKVNKNYTPLLTGIYLPGGTSGTTPVALKSEAGIRVQ